MLKERHRIHQTDILNREYNHHSLVLHLSTNRFLFEVDQAQLELDFQDSKDRTFLENNLLSDIPLGYEENHRKLTGGSRRSSVKLHILISITVF